MHQKAKIVTIVISALIIVMLGVIVAGSYRTSTNKPKTNNNSIIFFYGNTCPHCHDVIAWMDKEKVEDKVALVRKEVYDNQENAREMTVAAKACGLPTDNIGVPFLYAEGKCFVGTPDVINYLSEKAGINVTERRNE